MTNLKLDYQRKLGARSSILRDSDRFVFEFNS